MTYIAGNVYLKPEMDSKLTSKLTVVNAISDLATIQGASADQTVQVKGFYADSLSSVGGGVL